MNNLTNYTPEQLKNELLNREKCQFNKPGCTKTAELWGIKKLGSWEIQRNPICLPCAEWIEEALEAQRKAKIAQQKSQITKNHAPKL